MLDDKFFKAERQQATTLQPISLRAGAGRFKDGLKRLVFIDLFADKEAQGFVRVVVGSSIEARALASQLVVVSDELDSAESEDRN